MSNEQPVKTFVKKPITHLPGVLKPLEPPKPIQELDDIKVEMSLHDAKEWLESNLIPPYWVEEVDARSNIHSKHFDMIHPLKNRFFQPIMHPVFETP